MNDYLILIPILACAIVLSVILTYIVKIVAIKYNLIAIPSEDRWHKETVARFGSIAIVIVFYVLTVSFLNINTRLLILLSYCFLLFCLGFIDDIYRLKSHIKFLVQIAISAIYIASVGALFPVFSNEVIDFALSLFWLIGITNAFNLLDNMDGLAAGIAAISSIFYIVLLIASGRWNEIILLVIFLGGIIGFLVFNFNPAKIFMGNSGSYFIGGFLGSYIIYMSTGYTGGLFAILFVPVFILFIPILDTTFVTITRLLEGKPIYEGGVDHTSHRLVFLGLSERSAVLILYGLAVFSGITAVIIRYYAYPYGYLAIPLFMIIMGILGAYLIHIKAYSEEKSDRSSNFAMVILKLTYKQQILEIFIDVILVFISLMISYLLRFEELAGDNVNLFLDALPVFIVCQMICNYVFGIYMAVWKYTSVRDLMQYLKASFSSSAMSMLVLLCIYRFSGHSRSVYMLYAIIYFILMSASRVSFKLLHSWSRSSATKSNNTLLYGAGDAGELAIREILNNPSLDFKPVGFIDDDKLKKSLKIHGHKVLGTEEDLENIIIKYNVNTLIITPQKLHGDRERHISELCNKYKCKVMNVKFTFAFQEYPLSGHSEGEDT